LTDELMFSLYEDDAKEMLYSTDPQIDKNPVNNPIAVAS